MARNFYIIVILDSQGLFILLLKTFQCGIYLSIFAPPSLFLARSRILCAYTLGISGAKLLIVAHYQPQSGHGHWAPPEMQKWRVLLPVCTPTRALITIVQPHVAYPFARRLALSSTPLGTLLFHNNYTVCGTRGDCPFRASDELKAIISDR